MLLDRDYPTFPDRSEFDVVGLDHRRAGYIVTEHLIHQGAKRVVFLARAHSVQSVNHRVVGHREAMYTHNLPISKDLVVWRNLRIRH